MRTICSLFRNPAPFLRIVLFYFVFGLAHSEGQIAASDFVFTINADFSGDHSNRMMFETAGAYDVYYESIPAASSGNWSVTTSGEQVFQFPQGGMYRIALRPTGVLPLHRIEFSKAQRASGKLLTVEQWGTAQWSSFSNAFVQCNLLTTISATDSPNLSNATRLDHMFDGCTTLESVTGINSWDVSSITDMSGMFASTFKLNEPLADWDVSSVTSMSEMFALAFQFNQPLNNWDVSAVTNMNSMFRDAVRFNQPLHNWDVSKVTNLTGTFSGAQSFNGPLNSWDVSNVISMDRTFSYAYSFNQPLDDWNTSKVVTMNTMFHQASAFNQSLDNWNTANVTDMACMLCFTTSFNQSLGTWTLNPSVNLLNTFRFMTMNCANYNKTLIGWARNSATPSGLTLVANGFPYGTDAVDARNYLVNTKGWNISGDVFDPTCASFPVTLVSFEAQGRESSSLLTWSTTEETNSDRFEIQRSANAKEWQTIGSVPSSRESKVLKIYDFLDQSPLSSTNYYRLKMVDQDDTFSYSRIESVDLSITSVVRLYPNPASSRLLINDYRTVERVTLYNSAGLKLSEKMNIASQGIDISKLLPGMHMIEIKHVNGSITRGKFIIAE